MNKQEFLAFSLPYGLEVISYYDGDECVESLGGMLDGKCYDKYWCEIEDFKPILRPLSDLDSYNLNSPMNLTIAHLICPSYSLQRIIENRIVTNTLSMVDALELIRHHFDIADLISKGEAIDVNTLEINPYK